MSLPLWQYNVKDEEEDTFNYRRVPILSWLTLFFRETTLQGVPMVMKQPGIFKKLFWIFAIVACALGLYWELDAFFAKFLSWSATTAVSVQTARKLPFPAVTICNNNPVTTDWYNDQGGSPMALSKNDQSLNSNTLTGTTTPDSSGGNAESVTGGVHLSRRKRQLPSSGFLNPYQQQQLLQQQVAKPNVVATLQQKMGVMANASLIAYANRSIAGHQLCDMVMEMEYQGVSVSPGTNFSTWHWNPSYGNCYTYNFGYTFGESTDTSVNDSWRIKRGGPSGSGVLMSTLPGDSYGLYLLLNADMTHYLSWTKQVGWRIVIHNQTEMPFPEESGIFVPPGMSTRIGLSMSYIKRLGLVSNLLYSAPYSDCVDDTRLIVDDPRNAYSKMMEVSYSKSACLKTCYQRYVMQTCECFDFNYPNRGRAFGSVLESYPPCTYENETLWLCQMGIQQLYQNNDLVCDCPDTCTSFTFETTISYLKWPNPMESPLRSVCEGLYNIVALRGYGNDSTCKGDSYLPKQASEQTSGIPLLGQVLKHCSDGAMTPSEGIQSFGDLASHTVGSQFAEVYIFYKDFNYQTIMENEFLEFADLLAYMGGILGLFFGFTFLTLFEYVQLALDLILLAIGRLYWFLCCKGKRSVDSAASLLDERAKQMLYARRRSAHLECRMQPGTVDPTLLEQQLRDGSVSPNSNGAVQALARSTSVNVTLPMQHLNSADLSRKY